MTTMTQPANRFASRHHHPFTTATLVVLFWLVAAIFVVGVHVAIDPRSPGAGAVATIGVLIATAWLYTKLCAYEAGATHALGVGIAWLSLSIATEVALSTYAGHGWFALLGSPDRALERNVYLFVWIFAPAIFARRESK
ncbi:MAG: hypothetical protein M3P06_01530 [Acidobacteriota bacterium]|nr:hypothetical protein [Acidobacteriota bacterium]